MKRLFVLFAVALGLTSCTTPKFIFVQDLDYEAEERSFEITPISKAGDYFLVYKVNNSDYAILAEKSYEGVSAVENLARCLIMSSKEASELKASLETFVEKCKNKTDNGDFLAEVKIRESRTTETSTVSEVNSSGESSPKVSYASRAMVNTSMIIQAHTETDMFSSKLKYSYITKAGFVHAIELADIENLITALGQ